MAHHPPTKIILPSSQPTQPNTTYTQPHNPQTTAATNNTSAAAASASASASSIQHKQLNVKDALQYLDMVKGQFNEQPDVYNQFLEIMKDFKSQTIDTPGVIDRVSTLFKLHPTLITGFNTFLPPGYVIEIAGSQGDYKITTPNNVSIINPHTGRAELLSPAVHAWPRAQSPYVQQQAAPPPNNEFNHAINYVNKIKVPLKPNLCIQIVKIIGQNRFAGDPETYKKFLDVLQTYQKEAKPMHEVYSQVSTLFSGAADLLDEFKHFLPEMENAKVAAATSNLHKQFKCDLDLHGQGSLANFRNNKPKQLPPNNPAWVRKANGTAIPPAHNLKRPPGNLPPGAAHFLQSGGKPSNKKMKIDTATKGDIAARGNAISPVFASYTPSEELQFFDKVKRLMANKVVYTEFLKVLHLYSQNIIDVKMLVERVDFFIGRNTELMDWFKTFVAWEDKEFKFDFSAYPDTPPLDYNTLDKYGVSYRRLPKLMPKPSCRGRDALSNEVLNDDWVSHPTWASEDGGFIAHKKNTHEEALYRCEEERYEFDLNIESTKSVIAALETVQYTLSQLTAEEGRRFKLPITLVPGGSAVIYQRVIKKIYDKERGLEVIESLLNHPAVAVPLVLKRLKQKDEEWRRDQREWNKVWREVDAKNYYKALDHRNITFKTNEKKTLNPKFMITEIETVAQEQLESTSSTTPQYHLDYRFDEPRIFTYILELCESYMEKQTGFAKTEQKQIIQFLDNFMKKFLGHEGINSSGENTVFTQKEATPQDEMDIDEVVPLDDVPGVSMDATEEGQHQEYEKEKAREAAHSGLTRSLSIPHLSTAKKATLMGNTQYYLCFRLYQLLYSRLAKIRHLADEMSTTPLSAVPGSLLASQVGKTASSSLDTNSNNMIEPLLEVAGGDPFAAFILLLEQLFENSIATDSFEEQMRYLFGTSAYTMFTIDKLMLQLVKTIQHLVTDSRSVSLMSIYEQESGKSHDSPKQDAHYRIKCEEFFQDDDLMFKIESIHSDRVLTVELLGREDSDESSSDRDERWKSYVDNFVKINSTDPDMPTSIVLLKRNMPKQLDDSSETPQVAFSNNLLCKICMNTYKLFFVEHTEDSFLRLNAAKRMSEEARESLSKRSRQSGQKFDRWCQHKLEPSTLSSMGITWTNIVTSKAP